MQKTRFGDISTPFLAVKTKKKWPLKAMVETPHFWGATLGEVLREAAVPGHPDGSQSHSWDHRGSPGMPKNPTGFDGHFIGFDLSPFFCHLLSPEKEDGCSFFGVSNYENLKTLNLVLT